VDVSGETLRLRTIGPFTLRENAYAGGMALLRHSHPHAYITFVTEGAFRESYGTHSLVCRSGTIRYLPPAEFHENEILSPSRCLHITSHPFSFEELRQRPAVPRRPVGMSRLTTTRLANCLYAEFSREGSASATAIEGMVLELLAGIARTEAVDSSPQPPPWLKQAIEIVESRFLERLSLAEIAAEVGVHHVHLARQFHNYNRCTIGELIRRLRVRHASHLLAHSRTPLAEIALTCGFADQSHLSLLFKRYMGLSPSKFRRLSGLEPKSNDPGEDLHPPREGSMHRTFVGDF
jgi:AraC family transcriptional regulator